MQAIEIKLNQVLCGKSEEKLKEFPDNFFDGIVTDPPYVMGFMNKAWDTFNSSMIREKKEEYDATPLRNIRRMAPDGYIRNVNKPIGSIATVAGSYDLSLNGQRHFQSYFYKIAVEMLRTAKPGSFALVFGGTRTFHRVVCAIEDAGWIIRDQMMWIYGEGFPKSTNISKQIDKEAGVEREVVGQKKGGELKPSQGWNQNSMKVVYDETIPATNDAKRWDGYGTGLKPGWEPIIVAMKPLEKGLTYAQNAKKWGVAGLNIDGGRIGTEKRFNNSKGPNRNCYHPSKGSEFGKTVQGRFPSNVILSHSPDCVCVGTKDEREVYACVPDCPIRIMDEQSGKLKSGNLNFGHKRGDGTGNSFMGGGGIIERQYGGDSGGASRFFYCAKAKRSEKEAGLIEFVECVKCGKFNSKEHTIIVNGEKRKEKCIRNNHPTVKPLGLMRYLINLIKMPSAKENKQVVLDPFCGSGTTLVALEQLGINYIGIDSDSDSCLTSIGRIGA